MLSDGSHFWDLPEIVSALRLDPSARALLMEGNFANSPPEVLLPSRWGFQWSLNSRYALRAMLVSFSSAVQRIGTHASFMYSCRGTWRNMNFVPLILCV